MYRALQTPIAILTVSSILLLWVLAAPFIQMSFAMHAGIAFCALHAGIACLILHLHAGIVHLAFLASHWLLLIGVYPRVSVLSLAMIGGYL